MLACIACSKRLQLEGGGDESARGSSVKGSSREGVNSLISQAKGVYGVTTRKLTIFDNKIKDVVLKFSGSHHRRKGGSTHSSLRTGSFLRHQHRNGSSYTYEYAATHGGRVPAACSSSSTPAWELSSSVDVEESRMRAEWIPGVGTAAAAEAEADMVVLEEDREPREWMAQVEPGVHITFVSLPGGAGNDLKRIRFSQEMFNKWRAQRWWAENYDGIMELYNVQRYNCQPLQTPAKSDDGERESMCSTRESSGTPPTMAAKEWLAAAAIPRDVTSDACDLEVAEWVEQDEPGVHITIRKLADGAQVLRRVRFSRDKFGEVHAKLWWEANRERIEAQYL